MATNNANNIANATNLSLPANQLQTSSMFLVVNPLPSNDDEFNNSILETIEKVRSKLHQPMLNTVNDQNDSSSLNFTSAISNNLTGNVSESSSSNSNNFNSSDSKLAASQSVLQCVISRNHIAVLFEDNRISRFPFTISAERVNTTLSSGETLTNIKLKYQSSNSNASNNLSNTTSGSSSPRSLSSRRRLVRRGSNRSSASVIMGRNLIPAQYVPEELVNQAQVVLQGKSRNVIIRELQRTNLDVNSAVNNLLSRDDEDFDEAEDSPDQIIHSEDLISLLDGGFSEGHSVIIDPDFNDEMFSYPLRIRGPGIFPSNTSNANVGNQNNNPDNSTTSANTVTTNTASSSTHQNSSGISTNASGTSSSVNRFRRDEQFTFLSERDPSLSSPAKRWYTVSQDVGKSSEAHQSSSSSKSKKKSDSVHFSPMICTDQQEFWLASNDTKFVQIAALHNELIAINSLGQLCQWRWQDSEPFKAQTQDGIVYYHPRTVSLGLLSEKVVHLAASVIRATVVTDTDKVATWIDESIQMVAWKLEHSATNTLFNDQLNSSSSGCYNKIIALYVSSLMSCVQLSSGTLYWWGTPPYSYRKKMIEKSQNDRSSKSKSKTGSLSASATASTSSGNNSGNVANTTSSTTISDHSSKETEIVQGNYVCMRNCPIYKNGAIGYTTVGGIPKVGQLLTAAWQITDTCFFRVFTPQEIISKFGSTNSNPTVPHQNSSNSMAPNSVNNSGNTNSIVNTGNLIPFSSKIPERSEMPPPPSPASSTSSESSTSGIPPPIKRSRVRNLSSNQKSNSPLTNPIDDKNAEKTESWNLRDVVFLDEVKNMPIGRVIKVDGNYVAVKFNSNSFDSVSNGSLSNRMNHILDDSIETYIQDCRLLLKEDLVAVKNFPGPHSSHASGTMMSSKNLDFFQRLPKRIPIPDHMQILAITLTNLGLHIIAKIGGYRLSYLQINIVTGKIEHDHKLSIEHGSFFGTGVNSKSSLIKLFSAGENEQTTIVLCRDDNGTLYPLAKDCTNTIIREPLTMNIGPFSAIGLGVFSLQSINHGSLLSQYQQTQKTHVAILSVMLNQQHLMPAILNSDLDRVRDCLNTYSSNPNAFYAMISEMCDGNHNIIHIAVSACFPTSNRSFPNNNDIISSQSSQTTDDDDLSRQTSGTSESLETNTEMDTAAEFSEPRLDPTEQKPIAHSILWTLLDSPSLSRHLFDLLSARDYQGLTPFMFAISGRAYSAAQQILVVMQRVAKKIATNTTSLHVSGKESANHQQQYDCSTRQIYNRALNQMLYPRGSQPDHSPLYMLCSNDTCSFSWTGEEHINQDIFECRTCGLVGSLCCCTECARVCHRGHDCKLKRTSPTAYCDCWEKCKCKSLISGCQPARYSLLKRLLSATELSQRVNSRGEHILLFLVQTVSRQIVEQKQYRPMRSRGSHSSSRSKTTDNLDELSNIPDHNLEPPKFSRKVLDKLLGDWPTLKSMILTGYRAANETTSLGQRRPYMWSMNGSANSYLYEEENSYLSGQDGSALLDKFTHSLLKISFQDSIDRITSTIIYACERSNNYQYQDARIVSKRFVRSIIRVSSVLLFEMNPAQYSTSFTNWGPISFSNYLEQYLSLPSISTPLSSIVKKSSTALLIRRIRQIFFSLLPIACEELAEIAESLIAPVRLGLTTPSSSFVMGPLPSNSSSTSSSDQAGSGLTEEVLAVDPSIFSRQREVIESTFELNDMMDESSSQDNLPSSSDMLWNSFDSNSNVFNNSNELQPQQMFQRPQSRPEDLSQNDHSQRVEQESEISIDSASQSMAFDFSRHQQSQNLDSLIPSSEQPSSIHQIANSNISSAVFSNSNTNESSNSNEAVVGQNLSSNAAESDLVMDMLVNNSEPDDNSNVGGRDTESDSESNPDDASYLSNADNASAQRSVVTGATAGSDVGVASLPYDDESLNSNPDDVEDDDDDEQDMEQDDDDSSDSDDASDTVETDPETDVLPGLIVEHIDRRSDRNNLSQVNHPTSTRQNIINQVQWALRSQRDTMITNSSESPASFRRAISNALVSLDHIIQIPNSNVGLARAFSIIVRHIADLMVIMKKIHHEHVELNMPHLRVNLEEMQQLIASVEERLRPTWIWLMNSMDSTETQLRFGCALTNRRSASISVSNSLSNSVGTSTSSSHTSSYARSNQSLPRMRSLPNQEDLPLLPNFTRSNFRRNNSYIFSRNSSSAAANASSNSGHQTSSSNNAGNNNATNEANNNAYRDFLNYALSLMRGHSNEHYDSLPVLDVSSLKHVAYIFDAFVYYIRRGSQCDQELDPIVAESNEFKTSLKPSGRNQTFFRRSNSTLYLGCPHPDPFSAPFHEALPLANKPQLLQPNARREQLFAVPRPSNAAEAEDMLAILPKQLSLTSRLTWKDDLRTNHSKFNRNQLSISSEQQSSASRGSIIQQTPKPTSVIVMAGSAKNPSPKVQTKHIISDHNYGTKNFEKNPQKSASSSINQNLDPDKIAFFGNSQHQELLLGRWRLSLELFGRLFVDDISLEPNSVIQELSGFQIKETKFRREMERIRIIGSSTNSSFRDLNFFKLDRDRNQLLIQTFKELNTVFGSVTRRLLSQTALTSHPLTISRVKVTFKNEPGEGTGVARSFYTAFSEAVLAPEKLPIEILMNTTFGANNSNANCGRHSTCSSGLSYDSAIHFSSFISRRNLNNNNNSGSTNMANISGNSSSHRSGGSNSAPPNSSLSPINEGGSLFMSRRPRSPTIRYRSLYNQPLSSTTRRAQWLERVRAANDLRPISTLNSNGLISVNRRMIPLRYDAPLFIPTNQSATGSNNGRISSSSHLISLDSRQVFGSRLFHRISQIYPSYASKITGMLVDQYPDTNFIVNNEEEFRNYVDHAMDIIQSYETSRINQALITPPPTTVAPDPASTPSPSINTAHSTTQQQQSLISNTLLPLLAVDLVYEALGSSPDKSLKTNSRQANQDQSSGLTPMDFSDDEDNLPLFYQPGMRGFYCPKQGRGSENRLNAFRNVGRIIGICFNQNELCPISFCRHVIKMILGQKVAWHDLAFFDSQLYESLRQLILDAESKKESVFSDCDFRFAIYLPAEEGGYEIELIPNGQNIQVNTQNVYDYVRLYAQYRMVESQEKAIMAIRAGISDVIPLSAFEGLTAEDFRLLLNGINEINVQQLQSYVAFYDESGDPDPIPNFRKWFWWVVERMSNEEKQDLIYFWTGSPALPASEEGFQPMPSVTIRPRDDIYFVTANT
ncbi:alkaline phosphatase tissue-nonspecific isozyme [Sarcoptes scabiei]|nr:alkaline phosphatase tissue-nonspecific isozyme [Sarcoptes scabiei]